MENITSKTFLSYHNGKRQQARDIRHCQKLKDSCKDSDDDSEILSEVTEASLDCDILHKQLFFVNAAFFFLQRLSMLHQISVNAPNIAKVCSSSGALHTDRKSEKLKFLNLFLWLRIKD